MTETKRIRWEEEAGRGYELVGYVGTLEQWVFRAWESRGAGWTLEAQLPDVPSPPGVLLRDTLDELKAEAERWLEDFTSSLGAVFPDALLELADQWKQFAARGDAQDECADDLRETIAAALGGPATIEDVVADSIEQQSAYRNELRHLPGYMSSEE
jgi:hypothetical protein